MTISLRNDIVKNLFLVAGTYLLAVNMSSLLELITDLGAVVLTGGKIAGIGFNPLVFGHVIMADRVSSNSVFLIESVIGMVLLVIFSILLVSFLRVSSPVFLWIPAIGIVSLLRKAFNLLWNSAFELLISFDLEKAIYFGSGCILFILGLYLAVIWFRKYIIAQGTFLLELGILGSGILIPAMVMGLYRTWHESANSCQAFITFFCWMGVITILLVGACWIAHREFPYSKVPSTVSWKTVVMINLLALGIVGICLMCCPSGMPVRL